MQERVIPVELVNTYLEKYKIEQVGRLSIREVRRLINDLETASGESFVRMEMGIPGLSPSEIIAQAEIKAIEAGVGGLYPDIDGLPALKVEMSRFIRLFMNVDLPEKFCVPTVGSMNGSYAAFMVAGRRHREKNKILFIDPGFPVHKQVVQMVGLEPIGFDVYNFRGPLLREKLEAFYQRGDVAAVLYSNPNNPAWICFTEEELAIIGELSQKYGVVVIEDLAYFGMDFRKDLSHPGQAPFQSSVAHYCQDYILLISSSKSFSYAGQRIGMMAVSPHLFESSFEDLRRFYPQAHFGHALVFGTLYATTAGVGHSAQYGLAAILKAANDGAYNFLAPVRAYAERAQRVKEAFRKNGFYIVYDCDGEAGPIGDGFYFTVAYPGLSAEELLRQFLSYGISAISLETTGSERAEGLRACVSLLDDLQIERLQERLALFAQNQGQALRPRSVAAPLQPGL